MKKILILSFLFFFTVLLLPRLYAHHAMEYIEMESYTTALKGEFVFHLHYDYMVDNKDDSNEDHWELTPGLSYGIIDSLMFDIHCHFAKFFNSHLADPIDQAKPEFANGPSPFIEAAALSLQYRITQEGQLPINIAISGFFEMPTGRAKDLLDSKYVGGGILIFGWDFGLHNNITANFNYERDGDENAFGWALGCKFVLSTQDEHAPAFGVELLGDFEGALAVMPGFYLSLTQNTIFKSGILVSLREYGNDIRANITVMRRW